jgi:AraC family transcriptional regulator
MTMQTTTTPRLRLAALIERAPHVTFKQWHHVHAEVGKQSLLSPSSRSMAVFQAHALTGPSAMEWYAASIVVSDDAPLAAPLEEVVVEAGRVAVFVHRGPYDGLPAAWGQFAQELQAANLVLDVKRACTEEYVSNPRNTAPADLITELRVPVL